jgi:phosphomannomutase
MHSLEHLNVIEMIFIWMNRKNKLSSKHVRNRVFTSIGPYKIESVEDMDGFKFLFGFDEWIMVRPSGTEPVLRVYAQAADSGKVRKLLDAARETLMSV